MEVRQETVAASATAGGHAAIRSIRRRYLAVWTFYGFAPSFIFAVYPIFLSSRGLNQLQVNTVPAVYFLMWLVTDVPTGAFADAVGRRAAVVIGCVLHTAAFLVYFVSRHYWHFIAAEILDALATTFGNGPIDAWMVDALDAAGFEGGKDQIFSRQFQVIRLFGMIGAVAGSYVGRIDLALPFLICAICWIGAGAATLVLMHDANVGRTPRHHNIGREVRKRTIDSMRVGFADRAVLLMSSAALVSGAAWSPWWVEWQHYFTSGFGSGVQVAGWLFVAFSIAQMAGAEAVARMSTAWRKRSAWMSAVTALSSATALCAALAPRRFALVAVLFVIAHLTWGAAGPVAMAWYNEQIEGDNRATLLSFQSTFATLGSMGGLPLQGRIMDRFGAGPTWLAVGALSMLQVPCYLALRARKE
jgi:MFS family permease